MALDLYAQMFDGAESEQVLLQFFGSPTKQAVMVARSYQANAQGPATEEDEVPEFVHTILTIEDEARERQILFPEENKDQFSLFADEGPEPEAEPVPAARPRKEEEAMREPVLPAEESAFEEVVPAPSEEEPAEAFSLPSTEEEEKAEPEAEAESEADAEAMTETTEEEVPVFSPTPSAEEPSNAPDRRNERPVFRTVRKPRVLLLILYLLVSIPLGILGIALLLIPTLLCLLAAALLLICGVMVVAAAFSGGFAVFADLMVILGISVLALALGLLFLWLSVWFVGGAMVGLVRGLVALGGKWCYKEVRV